MRKSKFTDAQIAFVLRQAEEGTSVAEVCRKAGIAEATFYNWRKKYGGLMPSEMKRLKQLDEENARLKRLVADLSLDKAMHLACPIEVVHLAKGRITAIEIICMCSMGSDCILCEGYAVPTDRIRKLF